MKKLFLDTNIFLRFFLRDDESQYQNVCKLFAKIEEGNFKPYTSSIVFLELNYVVRNIYKLPIEEALNYINAVREMRGMTVVDKTDTDKAISLYKKYKIKLGDCFIVSQLPKETVLLSYDADFRKIKEIKSQTPGEILQELDMLGQKILRFSD